MPKIGDYRNRVSVLPRSLAAADATGEEVESWPDPDPVQEHWALIESPNGDENSDPRQSKKSMRLRFRTLVSLKPEDRVRLKEFAEVYAVGGVWRERSECGGWQTVCEITSILY